MRGGPCLYLSRLKSTDIALQYMFAVRCQPGRGLASFGNERARDTPDRFGNAPDIAARIDGIDVAAPMVRSRRIPC